MTYCLEIERTTRLVYSLAKLKKREIQLYELKMLQLKEVFRQNPNNSMSEYKYDLAKTRYDQLKRTFIELRCLEQKIESFKH
jgi:hypothetical protein